MTTQKRKSLKDRVSEFGNSLPFMTGREKGDANNLKDQVVTIKEYGFLTGDDGDYVVFTIKEDKKMFYFGSSVLTQNMQELEEDGYREEIEKDGLPVKLYDKKSKNGRNYVAVEFNPF